GNSVDITTVIPNTVRGIPFYEWQPSVGLNCSDCPNPLASPTETTTYEVTLIDSAVCIASDRILIEVEFEKILYVPNAFTPNGDGVNDVFYIYATSSKEIELKIFNRWGEKVFESFNIDLGWDGFYKSELQRPAVFTYHVVVTYLDGDKKLAKGSVTLVR